MKTCVDCGAELTEGECFCRVCGAAVEKTAAPEAEGAAAPAPAGSAAPSTGPSRRRAGILAAVAGAAVLVLAGSFVVWGFFSPARQFKTYQQTFLEKGLLPAVEQSMEAYNAAGSLSTDLLLTLSGDAPDDTGILAIIEQSSIGIRLESDRSSLLANVELNMLGSSIMSGTVTYGQGLLGLYFPEVDSNYYSLDLSELLEENQAGRLRLERPQFPVPLFSGLVKEYSKILLDAAGNENVTVEKGSYLLPESGMTAEGRLYVFQPGQKELEQMILKLADAYEKEDGLKQLIRAAGGAYGQWLYSQNSLGRPGESYEAFLDRTLSEMAARTREQAGEISAGLAEAEFRWLLGISGSRVQLQRLEWKTGAVGYESFGDETAARQDIVYSLQEEYPGMLSLTRSRKADAYSGRFDAVLGNPGQEFSVLFENVTPAKRSALGASYGTYELLYDRYLSDAGIDRLVLEIKAGATGGSDHVVRFTEGYSGGTFELKLHSSDESATVVGPDGAPVSISAGELEKLVSDLQTHLQYAVMGALF